MMRHLLHMLILHPKLKMVTRTILEMTVELIMVVRMLMKTQRRMRILVITEQYITNTPLKMRTGSFAFSYGKFYNT
jgi:hypothetical protein